ncbi:tight junction protein ZO-1 isoform X2 [Trichogramma pretiosum]|uniref:tight junction protein ZO-1 isoform X2 n=1 Tax=Trichogramma pretiosum TaxID=7493 RepID=UPI0006C9D91F|nr:tight junction protein ZO-1 isoform X2 [Trichogramma pretiosum]
MENAMNGSSSNNGGNNDNNDDQTTDEDACVNNDHRNNGTSASGEVRTLLSRHKTSLLRELSQTSLLGVLVKRSVLSEFDRQALYGPGASEPDVELFIELLQAKGFEAFREFCFALEAECPHVLTDLLVDQHALTEQQQQLQLQQQQQESAANQQQQHNVNSNHHGHRHRHHNATADSSMDQQQQQQSQDRSSLEQNETTTGSSSSGNNIGAASRRQASFQDESHSPLPPPPPATTIVNDDDDDLDVVCKDLSLASIGSVTAANNNNQMINHSHSHSNIQQQLNVLPCGNNNHLNNINDINGAGNNNNNNNNNVAPMLEVLDEPVDEPLGEAAWEIHQVVVTRVPGYGFGIAVSGGRDNPHFTNGDPAIAVSDVLKSGPAEGKLRVNDRIISANGLSLEGADYGVAVRVLRDSGSTVQLVVKRRAGGATEPPINCQQQSSNNPNLATSNPNNVMMMSSPYGQLQYQHQHQGSSPAHHHHYSSSHQQQQLQSTSQNCSPSKGGGSSMMHLTAAHQQQSTSHRLSLSRPSKKDDFGIVLGCRLFVREVTREGTGARPGDLVTRIAGVPAENMSLKEARKLMDQSKDRLAVVVQRQETATTSSATSNNSLMMDPMMMLDSNGGGAGASTSLSMEIDSKPSERGGQNSVSQSAAAAAAAAAAAYSSQNLYVPPPTRQTATSTTTSIEDKSNLAPRGRSRGPLPIVTGGASDPLTGLEPSSTSLNSSGVIGNGLGQDGQQPPRPPPPRPEDYYSTGGGGKSSGGTLPDPRYISFQKEGSVGVRLTGGNETGVFVSAVQPGSPAAVQGLQAADKILKVNDMDMKGVTREEAVLFLLSLQEQIDLIVQHRRAEYEQVLTSGKGDSFHVKTHFHYEQPDKGEMSFRSGDVFHVVDTLHNGVVGSWQVFRIGRNNQEVQKGNIPNKARAEELATAQFNATKKEMSASESRGSFFRRRKGSHRRSKSLGRDHWDDVVFSDSVSKFPAYERVLLRHPGFIRPVVLFGAVADLAREKLLKDFPDKFCCPQSESQIDETTKSPKTSGIIRLSAIREVMDRGKHALLDITPSAVDRLNYAQFYPIVIFFKADNKQIIKEMRAGIPKSAHRSSKKLLEQSQKLDKIWGHVFSSVITLASPESWYRKLRELIEWQQQGPLWMSQTKPEEALSDDFLFPMTSRLSYASSPESDLDLSGPAAPMPGTLGLPSRLKSSSDPSIATQDDLAVAPPPYTGYHNQLLQSLNGTNGNGNNSNSDTLQYQLESAAAIQQQVFEHHQRRRSQHHNQHYQQQQQNSPQQQQQQQQQSLYVQGGGGQGPPDLPPRLDRSTKPPTSPSSRSATLGRSAQERLINKTDSLLDVGNYINSSPHRGANTSATLDRSQSTKVQGGSYDMASPYDAYNNTSSSSNGGAYAGNNGLNTSTGRLGPNVPDDLKSSSLCISSRPHDPYRFTRSTAIPVQDSAPTTTRTDYAKYSRTGDYKTLPANQPKSGTGTYKPVPPPKPKNYRPPQQAIAQDENNGNGMYQHAKSYSMGASHNMHNGNDQNGMNAQRNSGQYYYNITPQGRSHQQQQQQQSEGNYSSGSSHAAAAVAYGNSQGSQHSHSLSHSQLMSSPASNMPIMPSHSYSASSAGLTSPPHVSSHGSRSAAANNNNSTGGGNVTMNGHSHSSSHSGLGLGQNSMTAINNIHNREPSTLDLAGSREQRGSAFELYRKPLHHHNMSRPMGMARGTFDSEGGVLEGPGGVTLIIPPGALPPDSQQEIYFTVTDANGVDFHNDGTRGHRSSISPPMHNGESMLSPLVECGPKGFVFSSPVELRIPHRATPAHRLALKATDNENQQEADWLNVKLPDPTSDHVIVKLDHF